MVSFTCGRCQDVVKKPKVLSHAAFCHCDHFTCVDCMNVFTTNTVKDHTTCVTETEKYQGKWKQRRQETHQQKLQSQTNTSEKNNGNNKQANKRSRSAQLNHFLNNDDDDDDDDDDDSWITQKKTSKNCNISNVLKSTNNSVKSKILKKQREEEEEEEECTTTSSTHQLEQPSVKSENNVDKQEDQLSKKDQYLTSTEKECVLENVNDSAIKHKHSRDNVMQSDNKNVSKDEICLQNITLGSVKEIREQLKQLYNENGVEEMTGKEIAAQLAEIYKSRIIHAIKQSLPLLEKDGVLICTTSKSNSYKSDEVHCNKLRKSHKRWRLTTKKYS